VEPSGEIPRHYRCEEIARNFPDFGRKGERGDVSSLVKIMTPANDNHGQHDELVSITIDNKVFEVRRGNYTVAQVKQIGGVAPAYDLLEQKNGKLHPLSDDAHTEIKGGEVFFSQPKSGASS